MKQILLFKFVFNGINKLFENLISSTKSSFRIPTKLCRLDKGNNKSKARIKKKSFFSSNMLQKSRTFDIVNSQKKMNERTRRKRQDGCRERERESYNLTDTIHQIKQFF